jgi:hypothetical protein
MVYTLSDLELADRHVDQGERHVLSQQGVLDKLHKLGASTQLAQELLEEFEATLASHRAHREQIKADLESH